MRDLDQAADLGIDTGHMVVVSHPDKQTRFGGAPARFTMTERAFVKRGLAARGFEIEGRAVHTDEPASLREQELEDEVSRLQEQLAAMEETRGEEDEKAALTAQLESAGVAVDKRWGVKRLRDEVAAIDDEDLD